MERQPQDESRVNVREEDLGNYYVELAQNVDGVPPSLVFNMDKAGQDEYVDTHVMKVITETTNCPIIIYASVYQNTCKTSNNAFNDCSLYMQ